MSEGKRRELSIASGPMIDKPDAQPVPELVRTSAPSDAERFEAWFVETFHGVPGLTTEMFNRFREAADRFKALLSAKGQ